MKYNAHIKLGTSNKNHANLGYICNLNNEFLSRP